jgi:hypothetical protein
VCSPVFVQCGIVSYNTQGMEEVWDFHFSSFRSSPRRHVFLQHLWMAAVGPHCTFRDVDVSISGF